MPTMAVYVGDDDLVPQRLVRPTHCRSRRLDHDPRRGSAAEYDREAFGLRRDPALDQLTSNHARTATPCYPTSWGRRGLGCRDARSRGGVSEDRTGLQPCARKSSCVLAT